MGSYKTKRERASPNPTPIALTKEDPYTLPMPTISVVIPAYNEEKYIGSCLESVLRHRSDDVIEIIVIDNNSTDRTAEIARGFPGVTVVHESEKGLTRARQAGFANSRGELLAYIDADSRMTPGWCDIVRAQFSAEPLPVCISGMYTYYDLSDLRSSCIRFLWKAGGSAAYSLTSHLVVGGNFVVQRLALASIGGFDTTIEFYGEDTDIGKRLSSVGRVAFVPSLHVETSGRRWASEGFVRLCGRYAINYVWQACFSKPFTKSYRDIR